MTGRFEATVVIDRPIEEVFAFLADGENDPKFSPRVLAIAKTTDGPPGVGTVYASTVKDAGMKTKREFKLTEFEPPSRIRWMEISTNLVTAPEATLTRVAAFAGLAADDDALKQMLRYHEFEETRSVPDRVEDVVLRHRWSFELRYGRVVRHREDGR